MGRKTILSFLIIFLSFRLYAGGGEYAVSRIPAALLKNAHAVKRMEKISFEVVNTGEAVLKKKYALTILNDNADRLAAFIEYYDKLHDIKNIEGTLYDSEGRELKRLKNKQILDLTGTDEGSLADDNRLKAHHFFYKLYPYTVEYEVEIRYNGTLFFPVWLPREEENFSVEQSSFMIISPASYTVRYKSFNYTGEPVAGTDKNKKTLNWEVTQLPAVEDEYASPDWHEINTMVFTGPTEFEIEKYRGEMSTWKGFGQFVYSLKQGRDQLPPAVKQTVGQIAGSVSDPKQKTAFLYEYLQKNTRYISIQLGIGGWQPFDATYVATKAYGDCKALTNYMYSLLKEAGITSYYTLVKAGRGRGNIIADFPAQQFNHVILCVPFEKDTMWLECTDQTLPAGYLGSHTDNRYALLVTEDGGKLVRTPRYGMKENLQVRNIKAILSDDATLEISAATSYSGLQQDSYHGLISNLSKDKVKEALHEYFDFATYDIRSFDYKEHRSALPVIEEKLDILVSNYATITGKRLFIVPNIMTRHGRKLSAELQRQYDIDLPVAYKDADTVEISIPEGYTPEAMPKEVSVTGKFGRYESNVKLTGNKLYYYRVIEHNSGRFPASDYPELVKFYETMYKADRSKVVLVKNQ
ncbi:MAG: DUF3857 domain-containing protein [Bacteroidota bacterium]